MVGGGGTPFLPRLLARSLEDALSVFPVVVITGARQTGKTTLVRRLDPDRAYLTLDDLDIRDQALSAPDDLLRRAERLQIATTLASYRMDEANLVDPRPGVDVDEIVPLSSRRYHVVRQFYAIDSERIDVVVSVTLLDTDLPPVSLASRLLRAATP